MSPQSPRRGLTTAFLDKLAGAARTERLELGDRACPGLRVRATPKGSVSFVWYTRNGRGKRDVVTLGRYPDLSLADARGKLQLLKSAHRTGVYDQQLAGEETTVAQLCDRFLANLATRRKNASSARSSVATARSYLNTHLIPGLGHVRVSVVTTAACREVIERVVARGTPGAAGRVFQLIGQMFNFGRGLGLLQSNPVDPLNRRALGAADGAPRQRTLTEAEIKQLWRALQSDDSPCSRTTRLGLLVLLLTAVRAGELTQAEWSHVDLDEGTWRIPPENRKLTVGVAASARDFVVPLAPLTVSLLRELKALAGPSRWVLASPLSWVKEDLHVGHNTLLRAATILQDGEKRANGKAAPLAKWKDHRFTPHDLRRTCRSYLGDKLEVEPHIAEMCLGHSLGKIVSTYDTAPYLTKRRAAMEKWAAFVERLVHGADAPVAFLPAKGRAS